MAGSTESWLQLMACCSRQQLWLLWLRLCWQEQAHCGTSLPGHCLCSRCRCNQAEPAAHLSSSRDSQGAWQPPVSPWQGGEVTELEGEESSPIKGQPVMEAVMVRQLMQEYNSLPVRPRKQAMGEEGRGCRNLLPPST